MIKAVTVDFWQTLFYEPPLNQAATRRRRLEGVKKVLAEGGRVLSYEELERAHDASGRRLEEIWAGHADVSAHEQVRIFLDALEPDFSARLPGDLLRAVHDAYVTPALHIPPVPVPGAASALATLHAQGIALAIVSNTGRTPGVILRRILERSGLLGRFRVLAFSDEVLVRKPAPGIFERTLEALGCEPGGAVHVGDDPVTDVRGARAAGMRVIHLSPNGCASDADRTIQSLWELPGALARV